MRSCFKLFIKVSIIYVKKSKILKVSDVNVVKLSIKSTVTDPYIYMYVYTVYCDDHNTCLSDWSDQSDVQHVICKVTSNYNNWM